MCVKRWNEGENDGAKAQRRGSVSGGCLLGGCRGEEGRGSIRAKATTAASSLVTIVPTQWNVGCVRARMGGTRSRSCLGFHSEIQFRTRTGRYIGLYARIWATVGLYLNVTSSAGRRIDRIKEEEI